ncbi:DUF4209 domain-containing protein [Bosea vestrisii]|uniref:DUF4209 domain-containing protein n=1 Tax=Bosea vestrisii TaxID=151416 RepID=UPI0024DF4F1F|nr:DUF4209 domain-containing protein [Bosea vestrisii]WID97258.1 DUF4209 domain-containing protein [Bosea vestrisii]
MTEQPPPEENRQDRSIPDGADIAHVLRTATVQKDRDFAAVFRTQHKQASAAGWDFLADLFDFHFTPRDAGQPFRPMLIMDGRRSMIPDDLSDHQLDRLAASLPEVDDAEYRARVGDVLWLRRRDATAARDAVMCYIASGQRLEDPDHWVPAIERYERAVRLARQIEPKGELPGRVLAHLEQRVLHYQGQDPLYFSLKALKLLEEFRYGDFSVLADIAGKIAATASASGGLDRARSHYAIQSKLLRRAGRTQEAEDVMCALAETFITEAEAQESAGSFVGAHHFWQKAVQAFSDRSSLRSRIPELRARLAAAGRKTLAEMKSASTGEVDISAEVEASQSLLRGRPWDDAFFQLAIMTPLIDVEKLREATIERMREFPLAPLIKGDVFDYAGRKIAVRPAIGSGDAKQEEQAIEGFMDEQARVHRHFTVHAILAPAIRVMRDEHPIDGDAIELVIKDSALVPEHHLSLFVKGVRAGFQFDFSTALHLLVPQVENGLRHVLEHSGVVPRNIDADGVEDVWLLGRILDHEKLREILDEDMLYELRTLMAGRLGPNLRNSIAHGLLNESALNGEMGFYLWWVIVRLICLLTPGLAAFVERHRRIES